jgi:hypothetical protein
MQPPASKLIRRSLMAIMLLIPVAEILFLTLR